MEVVLPTWCYSSWIYGNFLPPWLLYLFLNHHLFFEQLIPLPCNGTYELSTYSQVSVPPLLPGPFCNFIEALLALQECASCPPVYLTLCSLKCNYPLWAEAEVNFIFCSLGVGKLLGRRCDSHTGSCNIR